MARRPRLKTLPAASRDLISELPVEVKDRILECLPTRDAARTALLSRQWNHVWLHHGRLAFDGKFLQSVKQKQCRDDYGRTFVNIINNILFFRAGPVKKFNLEINAENDPSPSPDQYEFDRWCLYLSRNGVEEFNLSLYYEVGPYFQLPFCLLSCSTIKKLIVEGPYVDLPLNACGIFSNVTSLAFLNVAFVNRIASSISIPKLEKLAIEDCWGIDNFEISSLKLEILPVIGSIKDFDHWRWLEPHLKVIKTLWLCGTSLTCIRVSMFPTAINLRVLKLHELNFGNREQLTGSMQLLQKCPNLCELQIMALMCGWMDDNEMNDDASRLLEDQDSCLFIQELQMLNTIKIEAFSYKSALEMLFMKTLLSKSPALERVVILKSRFMNASDVRKILRKLERFPRASLNAQIVRTGTSMSEDWMDTHGVRLLGY